MKHLISVPPKVVPFFHSVSELSVENWFVSSDPEEKRIGSGGGTSYLLSELWKKEGQNNFQQWLGKEKRVLIHAGGKSRRLPAYAPLGKSLVPMPVFRWSRGQSLNQRLVHLQTPLFDKILENAPPKLNTLVASGDTLIFGGNSFPKIPDADIVCFGLWLEPDKATNHGVFFADHDNPSELQFMLQKPSIDKIQELVQKYYFLMDIGIWLLSERAIQVLMAKCGWENEKYKNNIPNEYDLYSSFGMALGKNPEFKDDEIKQLKVALVNLEGGEFYHMGNTAELVESNLAVQNRIIDQREIWHKNIKPQPSIFVLNARVNNNFTQKHKNIWIENSSIPDSWKLTENHAFTGVPENAWNLKLKKGKCLDFVPVNKNEVIIRNYGFTDKFKGTLESTDTFFMEQPLQKWLHSRGLTSAFDLLSGKEDIQTLKLFPKIMNDFLSEEFIQWLLDEKPIINSGFSKLWLHSERFSADEISDVVSFKENEKQRLNYQVENISLLAKNYNRSVFYQLDLKRMAGTFNKYNLSLPPAISSCADVWMSIHDNMFRAAYNREKGINSAEEEQKSFHLLQRNILDCFKQNTVEAKINLLPDQIAWGRSPVRLDIAGGWTDTPPYCMIYGGKVLNIAVELNGQPPLHCYIKATNNKEIVLRSIDLGAQEVLSSFEEIRSFNYIQSPFSIPKAALALAGFLPEFSNVKYSSLEKQLEKLGGGIEISILAAVPKGSGLGTSSILAATVLGTLSEVCCLHWDKMEIGRRTLALEQLLTTGGGWQDQYGGILDGIKLLETKAGKEQSPAVKWLPESLFVTPAFKNQLLLYYTGITRVAKNILAEIVRGMFLNSAEHLSVLEELKQHAANTYETILKKDIDELGKQIDRSWKLNRNLDSGTNTPEIQKIIDSIHPYIRGQKLLGAGGGGFMLIVAKSEVDANQIQKILTQNPVNKRARFVDFEVSDKGFQVTKS